jgi:peptide chain release factor 2
VNVRKHLGGIFDFDLRKEELEEVNRELEQPGVWDDPENAQKLGKERSRLEKIVVTIEELDTSLDDADELLEMSVEEDDEDSVISIADDLKLLEEKVVELEFRRMFSGELDANSAFVDIQSGSGGTEAQDWAEMVLRMYLRWGEAHGFKTELMEASPGEVAGIKSATISIQGPKQVCIVWSENHHLILVADVILHLQPFLFRRR